jgi:hypothetical protein
MNEKMNAEAVSGATLSTTGGIVEEGKAVGIYHIECHDSQGNLLWSDVAPNTISYQGKNFLLDQGFAASSYTASWSMSLITAGTATTASTYASPIVTEVTSSIIASRPVVTWTASASGLKTATATTFSIIGSATIIGNMLVAGGSGVATVGNTSATGGVFFSGASFAGGNKVVNSGDTLSVQYSVQI